MILFLALACDARNVSAEPVAIQVQVFDYANLSPAALREFVSRTQAILVRSGISIEVDACPRGVSTPCESLRGSARQVVIRVLRVTTKKAKRDLGESVTGRDGGTYASVFLREAEDQAARADVPRFVVLAYAAAHEVGHLLLGDEAHTPRGLMKARWADEDFQAMAQSRFRFSREQIRELKRRYGRARAAEIGANTSIAARH
jgi:hypothetical protein